MASRIQQEGSGALHVDKAKGKTPLFRQVHASVQRIDVFL